MDSWAERAAGALRFKQNEREVFRQLVRSAFGDLSKDIFRELAELDRNHVSRLREMAEGGAAELDEDAAHALRELTERAEAARDEAGALSLGTELKRAACEYYIEMSQAADNAFERHFWRGLAEEERRCLIALLDCQEYLTDPPGYFILKERVTLDG